jgi:cysteine synthase A
MIEKGQEGSLVTLICDSGDRYAGTYYSDDWLRQNDIDIAPYCEMLETFLDTGRFPCSLLEVRAAARQ